MSTAITKRRFLKLGTPSPLKTPLKEVKSEPVGDDETSIVNAAVAVPTGGDRSISSLSPYKQGQTVLCSYEGEKYHVKILEVSTKRTIDAINAAAKLAKQNPGSGAMMDVEIAPLPEHFQVEEGDTILFYVHYQKWNHKWDEWVYSEQLSTADEDTQEQDTSKVKGILKSPVDKSKGKKVGLSVSGDNAVEVKKVKFGTNTPNPVEEKSRRKSLAKKPKIAAVVSGPSRGRVHKKQDANVVAVPKTKTVTTGARLPDQPARVEPLTREDFAPAPTINCLSNVYDNFPLKLKNVLIFDHKQTTNGKMANEQSDTGLSAEDLLVEYVVFVSNTGDQTEFNKAEAFCDGLRKLINTCLPNQLLYMEEYESMMALLNAAGQLTTRISAIYILRALTRMDDILTGVELYFHEVIQMEKRKLLEFIDSRSDFYFPISIYIPKDQ